jgi:hypothetical protein
VSNSLRVVKTYRQVHEGSVRYSECLFVDGCEWFLLLTLAAVEAARRIIAADGILGLFGRGLVTRLLTNGLQGLLFSVLWKLFTEL